VQYSAGGAGGQRRETEEIMDDSIYGYSRLVPPVLYLYHGVGGVGGFTENECCKKINQLVTGAGGLGAARP